MVPNPPRPARPSRPATRPQRGYTLVEILVVIGIIAALISILYPVFVQARRKASQTYCASNLKQIGAAVLQYQQDYDGHFVPCDVPYPANAAYSDDYYNPGKAEWLKSSVAPASEHYLLLPYLRSDEVRLCPNRTERYQGGHTWSEGRYTMNREFSYNYFTPRGEAISRHDTEVPVPSGTMLVWEHNWNSPFCGFDPPIPGGAVTPDDEAHWESAHHGGLNVLWADGHVKRHRYRQLRPSMFTVAADPT